MKNKTAFSLIELMVVIGIISLICALAIPSYGRASRWYEIYLQKKVIILALKQAQENALTEQIKYEIKFDFTASPSTYSLAKINPDLSHQTIWSKNLSAKLYYQTDLPDSEAIFHSDGGVSASGEIDLSLDNSSWKKIIIKPIGTISEQ